MFKPHMLSWKDRKRIEREEEFKASLQERPNKLWSILNSAFTIWFLSVVVIGTFTWSYAQWQALKQSAEEIYRLDVEINSRLSKVEYGSLDAAAYPDTDPKYYPLKQLLLPPGNDNAIHAEYANRNLKSLIYELRSKIPVNILTNIYS